MDFDEGSEYFKMHFTQKEKAEIITRISGSEVKKCMKCGKCSASCPSYNEMKYHPHQFVSMVAKGDVDRLLAEPSVMKCLSCFACVERCPRGVEPANVVEAIRVLALREQGNTYLSPDEVPELLNEDLPQQAIVSAFRKYRK